MSNSKKRYMFDTTSYYRTAAKPAALPFYLRHRKAIMLATIGLLCALTILASLYYATDLIVTPRQDTSSDSIPGTWAMFRHDLSGSGNAKMESALTQGAVKWVLPTGGPIRSSPAVASGIIYVGSSDGNLYASDAVTGALRWKFQTGSWVESSPAVVNEIVYFGSNDGRLYALDANTGKKLWHFQTKYPIKSSPAVAGNTVYFGSDDYNFYALNAKTGKKRWQFNTGERIISSPMVVSGIVSFGAMDESFYALEARSGRFRLQMKTSSGLYSSPSVSGDTAYVTGSNGYLYAIDNRARNWLKENWARPFWNAMFIYGLVGRPPPPSGYLWSLKLGKTSASSPTVSDGLLIVGTDNKLVAVDIESRQTRWTFEAGGAVRSSPALAGNAVYAGSDDGHIYAVDIATGRKLWDVLTGGKVTSTPAVAGATVYVGSEDGNLYAIK
ncbi:MAG: PQQ-binding-like beta-propeller repeat protein [Chloroflexi bacterium]|nr:PQQ-binding-like beta-propeller repeat protein [Chloroflexota bacterium]